MNVFSDAFPCGSEVPLHSADWLAPNFTCKADKARSSTAGALALARTGILTETDVRARVLLTSGTSGSGVVARADQLGTQYYALRLMPGRVELVRNDDGVVTVLGSQAATINPETFYSLRLVVTDGTPVMLEAFFNGAPLMTAVDSSADRILSGVPGLLSGSTPRSQYDDFVVMTPAQPPAVASDSFHSCTSSSNLGPSWNIDGRSYCKAGKARGETADGTAFFTPTVPDEVIVRARVQLTGTATDSGVLARGTDGTYYAVRISTANRLEIIRVRGGITAALARADVPIPMSEAVVHRVGLRVSRGAVAEPEGPGRFG